MAAEENAQQDGQDWSIEALRQRIDGLDRQIGEALAERNTYVRTIGLKKGPDLPVWQPAREARQMRGYLSALSHTLPPVAVAGIWRAVIAAGLSTQGGLSVGVGDVRGGSGTPPSESVESLVVSYFGAGINDLKRLPPARALSRAAGAHHDVVALRPSAVTAAWSQAGGDGALGNGVEVVGLVPFIGEPDMAAQAALLRATRTEPTGDDRTVLALSLREPLAPSALREALMAVWPVDDCRVWSAFEEMVDSHWVVDIPGWWDDPPAGQGDEESGMVTAARRIGAFARPYPVG